MSIRKIDDRTYIIDFSDLEETVVVSIKMKKSFVEKIDEAARRYGFDSRSDFIRYCIKKVLNELDGKGIEENSIVKVKIM